jgi:hypothetical protein
MITLAMAEGSDPAPDTRLLGNGKQAIHCGSCELARHPLGSRANFDPFWPYAFQGHFGLDKGLKVLVQCFLARPPLPDNEWRKKNSWNSLAS